MVNQLAESGNLAAQNVENGFISTNLENIVIDNMAFEDAHDYAIRSRQYNRIVIQLGNTGAQTLAYEIYGTCRFEEQAFPFSQIDFSLLPNGSGTLMPNTNEIFVTENPFPWIIIRLRRMTVMNTEGYIRVGGTL